MSNAVEALGEGKIAGKSGTGYNGGEGLTEGAGDFVEKALSHEQNKVWTDPSAQPIRIGFAVKQ